MKYNLAEPRTRLISNALAIASGAALSVSHPPGSAVAAAGLAATSVASSIAAGDLLNNLCKRRSDFSKLVELGNLNQLVITAIRAVLDKVSREHKSLHRLSKAFESDWEVIAGVPSFVDDVEPIIPSNLPNYFCMSAKDLEETTVLDVATWVKIVEAVSEHRDLRLEHECVELAAQELTKNMAESLWSAAAEEFRTNSENYALLQLSLLGEIMNLARTNAANMELAMPQIQDMVNLKHVVIRQLKAIPEEIENAHVDIIDSHSRCSSRLAIRIEPRRRPSGGA